MFGHRYSRIEKANIQNLTDEEDEEDILYKETNKEWTLNFCGNFLTNLKQMQRTQTHYFDLHNV